MGIIRLEYKNTKKNISSRDNVALPLFSMKIKDMTSSRVSSFKNKLLISYSEFPHSIYTVWGRLGSLLK